MSFELRWHELRWHMAVMQGQLREIPRLRLYKTDLPSRACRSTYTRVRLLAYINYRKEPRVAPQPGTHMQHAPFHSYELPVSPLPQSPHASHHSPQGTATATHEPNRAMTLLARWRAAVRMVRAVRHAEQSLSLLLCAYCSLHIGHNDTYVSASRGFKCRAPAGRSPSTRGRSALRERRQLALFSHPRRCVRRPLPRYRTTTWSL